MFLKNDLLMEISAAGIGFVTSCRFCQNRYLSSNFLMDLS